MRFRLSEIEKWIDGGGIAANNAGHDVRGAIYLRERKPELLSVWNQPETLNSGIEGLFAGRSAVYQP
ncbi:hypothetical protein FACS1894151_02240 [Spirochaetia bacterium]|nr:hypothetical protein FACS1894151_02240 [Spirochaetia bacterium]